MPFDSIIDDSAVIDSTVTGSATATVRLQPLDWRAVLAADVPARRPLLEPILAAGEIAVLRGPRGAGKSLLALHLAIALARGGGKVLGWRVSGGGRRVLFVDGVLPLAVLRDRLAALSDDTGGKAPAGALHVLSHETQARVLPDLATPEGRAEIADLARNYDVIVLDSMMPPGRGASARAAAAWSAVAGWLRDLRRCGTAVLVVEGDRARGLPWLEAVADTVIALSRPKGHEPDEGARVEVRVVKSLRAHGPALAPFEASLAVNGGTACWQRESLRGPTPAEVWELHVQGLSIRRIAARLGLSKSKVHRWLQAEETAHLARLHAALSRARPRREVPAADAAPPPVPASVAVPPVPPTAGPDPQLERFAFHLGRNDIPRALAVFGWSWRKLVPWLDAMDKMRPAVPAPAVEPYRIAA
mgnify:FL=1